jgi:hypothetical protein
MVEDGSGNVTQISPHEQTKHMATSYNVWTGEGRKIDLDELAKGVQRLLTLAAKSDASVTNGIDVSRIYTATKQTPVDWDVTELVRAAKQDASIAAWTSDTNDVGVKGQMPTPYTPRPKPTWLADWQKSKAP